MQKTKIAAGDACDGGNGLRISEVGVVEIDAERAPMARQNERQLISSQGPVMVREADTAVKLREA